MEPSPRWLLILKDVAQIAGPIATAIIAAIGLKIARDGLRKWQTEEPGKRRLAVAEEALRLTYAVSLAMDDIRAPMVWTGEMEPREPGGPKLTADDAMFRRCFRYETTFKAFRDHQPLYGVYFGRKAMAHFGDVIELVNEIMGDIDQLRRFGGASGNLPEENRRLQIIRRKLTLVSSDERKAFEERKEKAFDALRETFERVVADERQKRRS